MLNSRPAEIASETATGAASKKRMGPAPAFFGLAIVLLGAALWFFRSGDRTIDKFILISIDTLRADHLGYAGYSRDTSPRLDALAAESLVFRNAFSHAPSTLPSHASMFTSQYPSVHRAERSTAKPLADGFVTMAERFRESGFRTAAFTAGGQMAEVWNLDQGFEVYDVSDVSSHDDWVVDDLAGILARAQKWISDNRKEPFFCFVHSYVVHGPYMPRPPFDRMFDEGYTGPLPYAITDELEQLNRTPRVPDDPDVRHVVSLYDGEIRYMDEQIGLFLDEISKLGLGDETMVVFTSDHGEEFAEHGKVGRHANSLFDELLHVPLLMRVPGKAGRQITRQVRLIDLAPTIFGVMEIEPPADFAGVDLLKNPEEAEDLPLYSEMPYSGMFWAALRVGGRKLVAEFPDRLRLFDLEDDPTERIDIAQYRPDLVRLMNEQLTSIMAENRARAVPEAAPVQLDAKTEAQLRALGYVK